jgi:hypothetical protein
VLAQDQQDADRRETQIRVLEAAVTAAVLAALLRRLHWITSTLTTGHRDVSRVVDARQHAAGQLSTLRVDLAPQVLRFLPRAAELGAQHVDAPLPAWFDPAAVPSIVQALERADATVQARVQQVATQVLAAPLPVDTEPAVVVGPGVWVPRTSPPRASGESLADRVTAVGAVAAAAVGDVVARTVATGAVTAAAAAGTPVTWWTEPGACLSCQSMAGSTPGEDGLFRPVRIFAPRIIPWLPEGIEGPPAHGSCRCHCAPATPGLVDALRREAEREVARGESVYDSLPARLKAVDRLLAARSSRIPKSVRERAARDRARGGFSHRNPRSAA